MKKQLFISCLCLFAALYVNAQTFTSLDASGSNKKIEWNTSNWGDGFGHKIFSYDPGGMTLLNIAARHNSASWTNVMTFTSNGNVGIGTATPNSPLTIGYNNASNQLAFKRLDGYEAFSMNINSYNQILFRNQSGGGDYDFQTNIGGQRMASALFIEGGNGNIGIGTTTPQQKLEVKGGNVSVNGSNSHISIIGTGTGNYQGANLILTAKGVNSGNKHASTWFMTHRGVDGNALIDIQRRGINSEYAGTLLRYKDGVGWAFKTALTSTSTGVSEKLVIKSNGNVGIGTTTPQQKLEVKGGNVSVNGSNSHISIIGTGTGNYQGANLILTAKGVNSGNKHASTWFMTHRGVDGNALIDIQRRGINSEYAGTLLKYKDGDGWAFRTAPTSTSTIVSEKLVIKSNGNVGIGTTTPQQKLEVKGGNVSVNGSNSHISIIGTGTGNYQGANLILTAKGVNSGNKHASTWFMTHRGVDGNALIDIQRRGINSEYAGTLLRYKDGVGWAFKTALTSTSTGVSDKLVIKSDGNVGIGTTTPDAKLAVNGRIHTKEVKVDLTGWPDFVFENNYDLPTLKEVEIHIKEKGHLANIPSAEEVKKEGLFLGEMNAKLLQKIEELTLYTIEQEKKLTSLKSEALKIEIMEEKLQNQTAINKSLGERLQKIETLLESKK